MAYVCLSSAFLYFLSYSTFFNASLFFIAFFSSQFAITRKPLIFCIHLRIFLIKSKIKGIGTIFPAIQNGIAFTIGILRIEDAIKPPRNSKIGIMESIIDKIDDLTNELILSMDSSKDGDVDNLIEDMEGLISSVKDYGD